MEKKILHSDKAPKAVGPYVQGIQAGEMLFLSGQLGFNMDGDGSIPESVEEQTAHSLKNLESVLKSAGADRNNIVKTSIFLTNMDDFAKVNEVYGAFFSENKPARSCVAVKELPKGGKVEIECIAVL